jgi:hypothetical protein
VAGDAEDAGAGVVGRADLGEGLAAMLTMYFTWQSVSTLFTIVGHW